MRKMIIVATGIFALIALTACTPVAAVPTSTEMQSVATPATGSATRAEEAEMDPTPKPLPDAPLPPAPNGVIDATGLITESDPPPFSMSGWTTDFTRRNVAWDEIFSGGPPKDGIPAVDAPEYESIAQAAEWLEENDPVIVFEHNGQARAYPQAILIWHEIVNDEVGGLPVSVTFCPLCNASITFDRRLVVEGETLLLDFGTTGRLRNSDLIMYDRQTESWWQQFTGQGIVGQLTGVELAFLPSQVLSFADFRANFPDADVLARPSSGGNLARAYGRNPYTGYDSTSQPFLFHGELDQRLDPVERVVGLVLDGQAVAYPFAVAADMGAINDQIGDVPLVIFHKPGTASALDAGTIAAGRDIGSVGTFDRRLDGQTLTFERVSEGVYRDTQTASIWNILGQATDGPLAGRELTELISFDHFWFAWAAFNGETVVYGE